MCGIVGYTGSGHAAAILLEGLAKLEYRGYDSAGIAVCGGEGDVEIVKAKGRLNALMEMTNGGLIPDGNCGIGHTRWATHGEPSEENAHPHASDGRNVVVVHNGIIENYLELREELMHRGYSFYSQTDTEVAAKLMDYYYKKYRGSSPAKAMARSMMRMRGSYALAVMFRDYPGEIFATRKDSPMVIGAGADGSYLASDVPAILKHTRSVYYMEDMEIAHLSRDGVSFCTADEEPIEKKPVGIAWHAQAAEKGGYAHFMLKEIHEQPRAVRDTLRSLIRKGNIDLSGAGIGDHEIQSFSRIHIVACGSAYHAGMVIRCVMEELARIPVQEELASEFRYRKLLPDRQTLVILVSQSGETADTLAALREAKLQGMKTLAIVNVVGSAIAREADYVVYTHAGPEIAVATTKAYSAQLAAGYLLAMQFALARGTLKREAYAHLLGKLEILPDQMCRMLEDQERMRRFAAGFAASRDAFFIGRGLDYAVAMEGSLKLKEVSYIHSEAYAAGEMKHGAISLVEDKTMVVGILTQNHLYEKMLSNMAECKSRGAYLVGITNSGNSGVENTADFAVYIPETDRRFAASLAVIPMQLMSYYMGVARGLDVDKPRNLAKSVTVE